MLHAQLALLTRRHLSRLTASSAPPSPSLVVEHRDSGRSSEVEGLAAELLAAGYQVQLRDGKSSTRTSLQGRDALKNPPHRFLVAIGSQGPHELWPSFVAEPIIIEPRFRDHFIIANPTAQYRALLQVGLGRMGLSEW